MALVLTTGPARWARPPAAPPCLGQQPSCPLGTKEPCWGRCEARERRHGGFGAHVRRLREMEASRARGLPSVRTAPVWTDTRGHQESAAQLRVPTVRPQRAAAPLNPKALSHEEAPCPPPATHPSTRPHARGHVTRTPPGTRAHRGGGGGPGSGGGCARTVSCRSQDRGPAPPRLGGRQRFLPAGTPWGRPGSAGRTDRRAGAARDAQTRGHYFCSKPRTAPHSGLLIKPRGAAPRPDAKHLCRPRPGPCPRRAAPPLAAPGRGLGSPPRGQGPSLSAPLT